MRIESQKARFSRMGTTGAKIRDAARADLKLTDLLEIVDKRGGAYFYCQSLKKKFYIHPIPNEEEEKSRIATAKKSSKVA